jgi:hypothetical protein
MALQRAAGNRAVAGIASGGTLARYTTSEQARAKQIREERGTPNSGSNADLIEARSQVGATDRETQRRQQAIFNAKGIASQDDFDDAIDRIQAQASIREEFICDRLADWDRLVMRGTRWRTQGMSTPDAAALSEVQKRLTKLVSLLTGHDLKAQRQAIEAAETAIDAFVRSQRQSRPELADQMILIKRYTLGHERKKLLLAQRIANTYGIKLDTMELIKANKKSYGKKSLEKYVEMMEPEVFSLEELEAIETVLKRYAPLLGRRRPKKLGAQPLTTFGRAKYGIDSDNSGNPQRDPDTRGESFAKSKTVGMYDESTSPTQFDTGMKQFRGTFAHELSHALIEDLKNAQGQRAITRYASATGVWTTVYDTPYEGTDNTDTWNKMQADGKEPPITKYGATNAQEDLADAIKFLFENPQKLKADCPIRYRWIIQNLSAYFDTTWFSQLPPAP